MKNLNLIYIFSASAFIFQLVSFQFECGSKPEQAQNELREDSIRLSKLKLVDKKKYIGMTVDLFLKDSIVSGYTSYRFADEPIGILNRLLLSYSKKVWLEIYVTEYKFMERKNMERDWKLSDFRKEIISEIGLVHNGAVVDRVY